MVRRVRSGLAAIHPPDPRRHAHRVRDLRRTGGRSLARAQDRSAEGDDRTRRPAVRRRRIGAGARGHQARQAGPRPPDRPLPADHPPSRRGRDPRRLLQLHARVRLDAHRAVEDARRRLDLPRVQHRRGRPDRSERRHRAARLGFQLPARTVAGAARRLPRRRRERAVGQPRILPEGDHSGRRGSRREDGDPPRRSAAPDLRTAAHREEPRRSRADRASRRLARERVDAVLGLARRRSRKRRRSARARVRRDGPHPFRAHPQREGRRERRFRGNRASVELRLARHRRDREGVPRHRFHRLRAPRPRPHDLGRDGQARLRPLRPRARRGLPERPVGSAGEVRPRAASVAVIRLSRRPAQRIAGRPPRHSARRHRHATHPMGHDPDVLSGQRHQLHRPREPRDRGAQHPCRPRARRGRHGARAERVLLDLCVPAVTGRLVHRQGRRAREPRAGRRLVVGVHRRDRRRARPRATGRRAADARRRRSGRDPVVREGRVQLVPAQRARPRQQHLRQRLARRLRAVAAARRVADLARRLARVVRDHGRHRHRVGAGVVVRLSRPGTLSRDRAGRRRCAARATRRADGCGRNRRPEGVVARPVPLPHRVGDDDRPVLPELRDLFLHHVVPELPAAVARLLARVARHVGHAARAARDSRRLARRLRVGQPVPPRLERHRRAQDLSRARHAAVVVDRAVRVRRKRVGLPRPVRTRICQPVVRRRQRMDARRRSRADARARRVARRHPELRGQSRGHLHHDLHRRDAVDHERLVRGAARGGRRAVRGRGAVVPVRGRQGRAVAAAASRRQRAECRAERGVTRRDGAAETPALSFSGRASDNEPRPPARRRSGPRAATQRSAHADETLRNPRPYDRRRHPQRQPRRRHAPAVVATDHRAAWREPVDGISRVLPARTVGADPRARTLGLLRRAGRAAGREPGDETPYAPHRRNPQGRHQQSRVLRARCGHAARHRAARFRVPGAAAVSAAASGEVARAGHAAREPVEHGRRPAARQRGAAPADRAALSRHRHLAADRRTRRHERRTRSAEPVPDGRHAAGRRRRRRSARFLRGAAGDRAARPARSRDSRRSAHRPRSRRARERARPARHPRVLVHDQFPESDRRHADRRQKARARRIARGAQRAADRGRRLRRTAFRPGLSAARARIRPSRPRDALQLVLEDARARLPDRLGRRRPVRGEGAAAQADDDAVGQHSRAGRHRELSRARRLRPAPARAARRAARAARPDGRRAAALAAGRRRVGAAGRRVFPVARVSRRDRRDGAASRGDRTRHQLRAGSAVFGRARLRALRARELRPSVEPRHRARDPRARRTGRAAVGPQGRLSAQGARRAAGVAAMQPIRARVTLQVLPPLHDCP
ncbi:conserved hypothetical protein [Burkholderia cenocepacia]|nr:conserved hypothetical protein [Burkholderia cenocepacia]